MDADTPRRSATAPTFSASPVFFAEREAFPESESEEEGLDKFVFRV
jgi:hypothetical protein